MKYKIINAIICILICSCSNNYLAKRKANEIMEINQIDNPFIKENTKKEIKKGVYKYKTIKYTKGNPWKSTPEFYLQKIQNGELTQNNLRDQNNNTVLTNIYNNITDEYYFPMEQHPYEGKPATRQSKNLFNNLVDQHPSIKSLLLEHEFVIRWFFDRNNINAITSAKIKKSSNLHLFIGEATTLATLNIIKSDKFEVFRLKDKNGKIYIP